jgi:hypothetical protein
MTTFIEEQLTEAMHERVADIAVPDDLISRTLRRQRRRTTATRTAYAGSVVGLAGVLTGGAIAVHGTAPKHTTPHSFAAEAPPHVRLVAAVSASRATSYRMNNTVIARNLPGHPSYTIDGAFDPTRATGYFRMTAVNGTGFHEERLIAGDLYRGDGSPGQPILWSHDPGKHTNLSYDPKVMLFAVSADPMQLLDALTHSAAAVTQTGPTTYHFAATIPVHQDRLINAQLAGDVTVGSDGRIARVAYQTTLHATQNDTTVLDGTLNLSDYGAPVTVERPARTFEQIAG